MRNAWLILVILPGLGVGAEGDIHRCEQADGTIAFQEIPCPEPTSDDDTNSQHDNKESEKPAPTDDFFDFANPFDETEETPARIEPAAPVTPSQDRSECEKTTRDAIDAIEFEMHRTKDEGRQHLTQLLKLTRQLRACKQL